MYGINKLVEARGKITEHMEHHIYLATVTLEEYKALKLLYGNTYYFEIKKVIKFKDEDEVYFNIYIDPRDYCFDMIEFIVNMFDETIAATDPLNMIIEKEW